MQTNPIPGVMNTLKDAKFDEEQRLAITTSITDMQYPLLDAIEKLESRMDARFEKMESRLRNLSIAVYGLIIPILFIVYQVAPTAG